MKLECGHEPAETRGVGTGHAVKQDGSRVCYQCCRDEDLSQMNRGEPITLYLNASGLRGAPMERRNKWPTASLFTVKNWPGTLTIAPTAVRYHEGWGFGRPYPVYHVWFIGPDDHVWWGRNAGDNEVLHCRRTRERVTHA